MKQAGAEQVRPSGQYKKAGKRASAKYRPLLHLPAFDMDTARLPAVLLLCSDEAHGAALCDALGASPAAQQAHTASTAVLSIDNKYYTAEIGLVVATPTNAPALAQATQFEGIALVAPHAHPSPQALSALQSAALQLDETADFEIRLLIADHAEAPSCELTSKEAWVSDTQQWCQANLFEYCETCSRDAAADSLVEVEGEACGIRRVRESLEAHMWGNMTRKPSQRRPAPTAAASGSTAALPEADTSTSGAGTAPAGPLDIDTDEIQAMETIFAQMKGALLPLPGKCALAVGEIGMHTRPCTVFQDSSMSTAHAGSRRVCTVLMRRNATWQLHAGRSLPVVFVLLWCTDCSTVMRSQLIAALACGESGRPWVSSIPKAAVCGSHIQSVQPFSRTQQCCRFHRITVCPMHANLGYLMHCASLVCLGIDRGSVGGRTQASSKLLVGAYSSDLRARMCAPKVFDSLTLVLCWCRFSRLCGIDVEKPAPRAGH